MNYAIVLYLDNESNDKFGKMMREIAEVTGSDFLTAAGSVPHITIASIECDDEVKVLEHVSELAKVLKQGWLWISSIGVFKPAVLYLAPVLNETLQNACEMANEYMLKDASAGNRGIYMPYRWVPHIAVANKLDASMMKAAIDKALELFEPGFATATKLALIKSETHNPYQELVVYDLAQ